VQAGWISVRDAGYNLQPRAAGYNLQPGHLSSLPAPSFQAIATQEPDGLCGNQYYSREILMMGIEVPEFLQPGHLPSLLALSFQPTATQEPDGRCVNQHYSREILMMGIVVPEIC